MAEIGRKYKLANPGKRKGKKRLTLLQKAHFGTKRQRLAANMALSGYRRRNTNPKRRLTKKKSTVGGYSLNKARQILASQYRGKRSKSRQTHMRGIGRDGNSFRQKNIGEILAYHFPTVQRNPSSKKRSHTKNYMAKVGRPRKYKRRRPSNSSYRRRRRTSNPVRHHAVTHRRRRSRTSNPHVVGSRTSNPHVVVRYRNHRPRHNYHRRRNPGISSMFGGRFGKVFGVIGGATLTKLLTGFVPASINTGFMGYISTAVVAVLQGKLIGKVFKSPALGDDMMIGGFTYLAIKVLSDFFPNLSPFGLNGMGLLGGNNFYVPQVPVRGSMGQFLVPPGIPAPVMVPARSGLHGINVNAAGGGRMGMRRMGRVS